MPLVFLPGITTQTDDTQISGRGIGLDAVEQAVERLGGSVGLASSAGEGTVVTLRVPVSSIQVNALAVRIGDIECAIPIEAVVEIMSAAQGMVEQPGGAFALRYHDDLVSLRDLAALTGLPRSPAPGHVVIVEDAGIRFGVLVDRVLGERQILHRSKGAFLAGSRTLRDVGVSNDGTTMIVLDPGALADPVAASAGREHEPVAPAVRGRVLVVDDSELTRDLLVKLARDHGHEVDEAVDGEDALIKIGRHPPDVVVTDLEMPLLDGFGLLHRLRESAELRDIPVVVLSTRGSREDIRRASELGAAAYVVKSELEERRLARILERLIAAPRQEGS
jgi:CheY-like chemotaxis protein/chemotaxis signal transduction protein